MEQFVTGLVAVCLLVGIFFAGIGVLGILRFPDYFSRAQASTCITSMGSLGSILAGIIYCAYNGMPIVWYVKLILICMMLFVSCAVSGHSLTKGTYKRGHRAEGEGFVKNDYEEDGYNGNA